LEFKGEGEGGEVVRFGNWMDGMIEAVFSGGRLGGCMEVRGSALDSEGNAGMKRSIEA
jgi:hypothetical protein